LEATRRSRTGKPSTDAREIAIDKTVTGTKEIIEAAAEAAAEEEVTADEAAVVVAVTSVTRAIKKRTGRLERHFCYYYINKYCSILNFAISL
jgi:hypothetical protein